MSPIYLFTHSIIYIGMDSWIFILWTIGLLSILVHFFTQIIPALNVGSSFSWLSFLFYSYNCLQNLHYSFLPLVYCCSSLVLCNAKKYRLPTKPNHLHPPASPLLCQSPNTKETNIKQPPAA